MPLSVDYKDNVMEENLGNDNFNSQNNEEVKVNEEIDGSNEIRSEMCKQHEREFDKEKKENNDTESGQIKVAKIIGTSEITNERGKIIGRINNVNSGDNDVDIQKNEEDKQIESNNNNMNSDQKRSESDSDNNRKFLSYLKNNPNYDLNTNNQFVVPNEHKNQSDSSGEKQILYPRNLQNEFIDNIDDDPEFVSSTMKKINLIGDLLSNSFPPLDE